MGTRLRSVARSMPKPLVSLGNMSFLELLVRQLAYQGIGRVVMCTGHFADQIENRFGDGHDWNVEIEYSKEPSPLGTGGAVKLARPYLQDVDYFLVMNGDSFLEINFAELIQFHRAHRGLVTMAVLQVKDSARYGTVQVNTESRVTGFTEKTGREVSSLVNAGVYVFSRTVLDRIPDGPASLERDVFPPLLAEGIYAFEQHGMFIDIGTPEDYARAQRICDRLYEAAFPERR